jgi:hypothetical protein
MAAPFNLIKIIGRAPAFDTAFRAIPRQPAPTRLTYGTRRDPLTAAPSRA